MGYIDLLSFIDFAELDSTVYLKKGFEIDIMVQESIIVSALDNIFIIGYSKIRNKWELLYRVDKVSGVDPSQIKSIKMVDNGS